MGLKDVLTTSLFDYLRARTVLQKLADAVLIASLATWLGIVYVGVSNFEAVQALYRQLQSAADDKVNLSTAVVLNARIEDELSVLRSATVTDRAYVAKFHNGRKDIQGFHFIYSSRINEVVGPGIASTMTLRQNVLLSIINDWVAAMLKGECMVLSALPSNHAFAAYLREGGVRATIFCPIKNNRGDLIGTIGVEYVGRAPTKQESDEAVKNLRESATRMSGMFTLRDGR